ncbi:hypothetical protein [Microbacterium gubbeenense]|uniref:hypothetical protein n=1 Tax=Microbacteriaceae TaxID=85023 RepID=UPI003F994036
MAWRASYSQLTTASPESVWRRWTTPSAWAEDDPGLETAQFACPPTVGTHGWVKNHGSPRQKITFTVLDQNTAMNFKISLPGAVLSFPHEMRATPEGLVVTHNVQLDGLLAGLYGLLVGRGIARGLPAVVRLVTEAALRSATGKTN